MSEFEHGYHHEPPPFSINLDRNVAYEEQLDKTEAVNATYVELIKVMHYEQEVGHPPDYYVDDIDHDRMIKVSMDKEFQQMVLFGIGYERRRLEREGVIFNFRKGGGDTR